ncbi:MAG: endonuclease MutS2 [Firmicutes bacterium]|nr:endonuclease MutS2 [Bacillota bacterium]
MEREMRVLEFDKIRLSLAEKCITPLGRQMAETLAPAWDGDVCRRLQAETSEAVSLLSRHYLGMEAVPDLNRIFSLAARGGILGEEQLWQILKLLLAVTKIKLFFQEKEGFPLLGALAGGMNALPALREELKRAIDEEGRLREDASPEYARLNRAIAAGERALRERFDRFVKNPANQKLLQENLVTVRGDRMVVPVRVEYRSQVQGVVHDQSASGATLFIEPLWAVEAHNQLSVLRRDAEREKNRILAALSKAVGAAAESLASTLRLYAELDLILARGRQSLEHKGVEPLLDDKGHLRLVAARHPLLTGEVVPISLEMGGKLRTMVITGPNTGGKTVTLKTVGLFALMAQSGLHVPAEEGTALPVFPRIFADIGDEQDISQSLSTFSGHMKNIVEIIHGLVPDALVLLDEVGAGTDPTEGAGLAMAILEYLHRHGAMTVATTHYSELKTFAWHTEGMENASVEFDVATLRPTYRLLVGVPGVSNAFAIAKRLGLPEEVIARAADFLSREELRLEKVVADLVADRKRMEYMARQAEEERRQAQSLLRQVQQEKEKLEQRKAELLAKAREEALEIVARAKREARQIVRELRKMAAQPVGREESEQAEKLEEKLHSLAGEVEAIRKPAASEKRYRPGELSAGMVVRVPSLGQAGTVVQVEGEQAQVQIGPMRVTVNVTELAPAPAAEGEEKQTVLPLPLAVRNDVPREIDLRGLTLDEATMKVDTYLAEAVLADLKEVRLIHGKGTGRLRAGLKAHLQGHPRVAEMRMGHPAEGGTGVTVVRLK